MGRSGFRTRGFVGMAAICIDGRSSYGRPALLHASMKEKLLRPPCVCLYNSKPQSGNVFHCYVQRAMQSARW